MGGGPAIATAIIEIHLVVARLVKTARWGPHWHHVIACSECIDPTRHRALQITVLQSPVSGNRARCYVLSEASTGQAGRRPKVAFTLREIGPIDASRYVPEGDLREVRAFPEMLLRQEIFCSPICANIEVPGEIHAFFSGIMRSHV